MNFFKGMPIGQITYFIESIDPSLPFYVRNDTGDLIAFTEIDREQRDFYQFNVIVSDYVKKNLNKKILIKNLYF